MEFVATKDAMVLSNAAETLELMGEERTSGMEGKNAEGGDISGQTATAGLGSSKREHAPSTTRHFTNSMSVCIDASPGSSQFILVVYGAL